MPRLVFHAGRNSILRAILANRGVTGKDVAKATKKPVSTVTYQIRNADKMTLAGLQMYVNVLNMTDAEIVSLVRGE